MPDGCEEWTAVAGDFEDRHGIGRKLDHLETLLVRWVPTAQGVVALIGAA